MDLVRHFYKLKAPLILLSLVWAIGLLLGRDAEVSWIKLMIGILLSLVFFLFSLYFYYRRSNLWFVFLLFTFLYAGFNYMLAYQSQHQTQLPEDMVGKRLGIRGFLASEPVIDGKLVKFQVQPFSYQWQLQEKRIQTKEKLIVNLYLKKETDQEKVRKWANGMGITFYGILEKPSPARNPGQFDYSRYLANQNVYWQIAISDLGNVQVSQRISITYVFYLLQNQFSQLFDRYLTDPQSGFMKSLILGNRHDLSSEIRDSFSTLGLSHIIAISGLHLTILTLILSWLLANLGLSREKRGMITGIFLVSYMFLVGASASVIRATLMSLVTLYGLTFRKSFLSLQSIGITFLLMTLYNPKWIYDVGFQLSFVVTFFLIWGYPKVETMLRDKVPSLLLSTIAILIITQLASFPLLFYHFHQYSLLSWFANLLFVPIFSFAILPMGLLLLVLGLFHLPFAIWIGQVLDFLLKILFKVIADLSKLNGFEVYHHYSWWIVVLLYCILIWWLIRREIRDSFISYRVKRYLFFFEKVFLILSIGLWFGFILLSPEEARVTMIDVGQGDSFLIESPQGKSILIDSGGTLSFTKESEWEKRRDPFQVGEDIVLPYLHDQEIKVLDYAVLTHEDADHLEGYLALVDQIPIRWFIVGEGFPRTELGEELYTKLNQKQIPIKVVKKGESHLSLDQNSTITFLSLGLRPEEKENNQSLITYVKLYQTQFLFMGDLEQKGENQLIQNYSLSTVDFLKVGHHGSQTSTTPTLLDHLHPREALISVGMHNRYGHPSEEVISRLKENQIDIWRTDQDGAIIVHVNPKGYEIEKTLRKK
ncbi:DNA internalization-related competence protein ComEC/Rec2 [Tepidibacillus fermentans]|uniref:Competence protein ComEC n=1 Tax=Tepidibacillus fermentans TaxID=1281767 RepID=A0A4R3KJR4_9BACI|nr:DNA internalization-related competence protein ComEC/Rec2 [Tepidibacillus fermentans]TCS83772.1 competence protein ComEC [Tepidibacillus fermentans]